MAARNLAAQTQQTSQFAVGGGLDLVTPAIKKGAGYCISALNYEPRPEGYRRIDGHERFDGRPAPSAQLYWILNFTAGLAAITAGQTVTGNTSGATGIAVLDAVIGSGSYGASNAVGYLVLRLVSGTFVAAEALKVGGVTKSTSSSATTSRGAANDTLDGTYLAAAMEQGRALIQPVPGSGSILGVWYFNGLCYAFRNNVGGTATAMYVSSATGWTAVSLGGILKFTTGLAAGIVEGDTVTGATSAATAIVKRLAVQTGTFGAGTAAGYLVFASITGAFVNGEFLTVGGTNRATTSGIYIPTVLAPNGSYEFVTYNFYGASNLKRMYGCDGVNNGFEFDGTIYAPIFTGMVVDTPTHIQAHYNHLFLAFPGGSLQNSSIGAPLVWNAILGATELGIGDDITGLVAGYNGVMVIYGRDKTAILYGTDATTWQIKDLSIVDGAYAKTAQLLLQPTTFDNFGIRGLTTIVPTIANFAPATLSTQIRPLIDAYNNPPNGVAVMPTASIRVRRKNQYRLFFTDGSGAVMDVSTNGASGNPVPMFMPLNYGKTVRCACSAKDNSGNEICFFGSDDGYIYQLDSGNNFDGQPVPAVLRLAFNNLKTATQNKRFHKATLELASAQPNTAIFCSAEFSGGDPDQPGQGTENFNVNAGGAFWNEANWDQFYWSSRVVGSAEARIDGAGTSISLAIGSSLTYQSPYVISGVTLHYTMRGLKR